MTLVLAAIFAWASPHASNHAGGLWSHNTGGFFLLLGLALLLRSGRSRAVGAAIALALAFTMRNDYIVFVAGATGFVWFCRKGDRWAWIGAGAFCVVLFFAYYIGVYGTLFHATHRAGWGDSMGEFPVRWAGLWFSPNRGLFVFTPLFLFSLWGLSRWFRQRKDNPLLAWFGGALLAHSVFMAGWPIWWGGWSYGPRFFAGVSGLWCLALMPLLVTWHRRFLLTVLFVVAVGISLFVHLAGMYSHAVHDWNDDPVDVDEATERVWDARDWMPMRIFAAEPGKEKGEEE